MVTSGITKSMGWRGRGEGRVSRESTRCKYYFLWIIRVHIQLLPFENCLPRCRFQTLNVVASLSQQVTKLAWLHVFLLLKISPFVVCTLQYIPDSTVTGTLKPQGRGLLYERGGDARRLSWGCKFGIFFSFRVFWSDDNVITFSRKGLF